MTTAPTIVTGDPVEAVGLRALPFGLDVREYSDLSAADIRHRHFCALVTSKSQGDWMADADVRFAQELYSQGAKGVRWLLVEGLPATIQEWPRAGLTEEAFMNMVHNAPLVEPDKDYQAEKKPRPFQFDWEDFTVANFGDDDDPPEPILEGSLYRGDTGLIVAAGGTGKGYLAAQLGASLATGSSFFGVWSVPHSMRVLYISAEESQRIVKKKVRGSVDRLDLPADRKMSARERYVGKSIVGLGGASLVRSDGRGGIEKTEHMTDLHLLASSFKPDVIFLDHLSKLCPVNEIDNSALTVVSSYLEELAVAHRCAVLIMHHANKSGPGGVFVHSQEELYKALDPSAVRGGTSLVANVRWALLMAPIAEDFAPKLIGDSATGENSGVYVASRVSKKNEGAQEATFYLKHDCDGFFDLVEAAGSGSVLADAEALVREIERRIADAEEPLSRAKGYEHLPKWGRRRYSAAVEKGAEMGWLRPIPKALGKGEILILGGKSAEVPESAQIGGTY